MLREILVKLLNFNQSKHLPSKDLYFACIFLSLCVVFNKRQNGETDRVLTTCRVLLFAS